MTKPCAVALLCLAALTGCAPTTIRLAELPWTVTPLSKEGCANLTGTYKDRGSLHLVFSAGLTGSKSDRSGDRFPATTKWLRTVPWRGKEADQFHAESLLSIEHGETAMSLTYTDGVGIPYEEIQLRLDTEMTGCHDGALILRKKTVYGKYEGSSASIDFDEFEIRLRDDRSLEVVGRGWISALGLVSGKLTGPLRSRPGSINRYPAAPRR